ncbi:MAG: PBSX family phage terminase large subunit [Dialister sp.]|nr:PBSX family phage terminase large subunit [Dialister sp.]
MGGIASGKKRAQLKSWKEVINAFLNTPLKPGRVSGTIKSLAEARGMNLRAQDAMVLMQIAQAMKGNTKAFELLVGLSGLFNEEQGEITPLAIPDDTGLIIPAFDGLAADIKRHLHTHYWIKGGRGSTKSSFISLQIPKLMIAHPDMHAVVLRKVGNTLKNSVYQQIEWALERLGLLGEFSFKKSPMEITLKRTGQKILFFGVDDKAKLKSLKMPFGYVGLLWYEELDQFAGMEEIRNINQSVLRGSSLSWCFYSFNPPKSRDNWVNEEQLVDYSDRLITAANYTQVPPEWLGEQFLLEADKLKARNETAYRHEYMGEITGTGGAVFENIQEKHFSAADMAQFTACRYGLDFGFAVDPLAFVVMHYDAKREILYIFDEIYEPKLTNRQAAARIQKKLPEGAGIHCDSAEPKSIKELKELGLKAIGARKGIDSVDFGIRWLQGLEAIVIDKKRCPNTYREFVTYEYEQTKDGQYISAYPDKNNHAIDAVRFGLDGFHAVSMAGVPPVQIWLPDFNTAGAVKPGEVEMVAAVALKATKAAAVLRDIKVK